MILFNNCVLYENILIFNRNKKEIWPIQQAPIEKFIIHHTAGSDGGDDPAATIRGIYYWHAVVLGWGDMGYNFLIDGQGNFGCFTADTKVATTDGRNLSFVDLINEHNNGKRNFTKG